MTPVTETQVVHFSVEGEFVCDLARQVFVEGKPQKAVRMLVESFVGLPEHMAIEIVTGKKILKGVNEVEYVDDNETQMYGIPLSLENMWSLLGSRYLDRLSLVMMYKARIKELATRMSADGALYRTNDFTYPFSLKSDKHNYIRFKDELKEISDNLSFVGGIINKTISDLPMESLELNDIGVKQDLRCLRNDESFEYYISDDFDYYNEDDEETVEETKDAERRLAHLDNFIVRQIEIDEKMAEPIKPNPITDMNSAGWLAPNGDWYGLDGEVANQLHNTLADAIREAGIIDLREDDCNPDYEMLKTGWIKVHGLRVLFEGNSHGVSATKEQLHQLYVYGQHTPMGYLCLGWKFTQVSAVNLSDMDADTFNLYFKL